MKRIALLCMLFILYYSVNVGGEWTITKAWATLTDAGMEKPGWGSLTTRDLYEDTK